MSRYKTILLVEDDEDDQIFFAQALAGVDLSTSLTIAKDGEQALKQIPFVTPDLIFLDMYTPVMDGFEFLAHLRSREKFKYIPVIVLTGSSQRKEECYMRGATAVVQKPFSMEALRDSIRNILSRDVVEDTEELRVLFGS